VELIFYPQQFSCNTFAFFILEKQGFMDNRFKHLGPIEHPDETGIYMDVLSQCIGNPDINNIAISGPYASGKSSVINKYLNNNIEELDSEAKQKNSVFSRLTKSADNKSKLDKVLTISIAAFQEETSKVPRNDAEDLQLRILQQILYTATGAELPQSRFNRIKNIKRSLVTPTLFCIWSLISYVLIFYSAILTVHKAWSFEFMLVFSMVWVQTVLSILGIEWLIHFFSSKKFSKISLKNLEFEKSKDDDTSILSKYFDEILYFFDIHPYELVIFEDLDRFIDASIFSKLRELNTLLNQNRGRTRKIQFIYALKDSMFATGDRTKFFDFILPIVPVTGTANSEDEYLERNRLLAPKLRIENDLLRDVAQFVTEPRNINNTFNEYVVYKTAINNPNLNSEQLFSLILYKNIFVHDFDDLHYGTGKLYEILTQTEQLKQQTKLQIENSISELEEKISNAEKEKAFSETELINIYLGQLYRQDIQSLAINHYSYTALKDINSIQQLKQLMPSGSVQVQARQNNGHVIKLDSLEIMEKEINPGQTIDDRLAAVMNKNEIKLKSLRGRLPLLRKKLKDVELSNLQDLCEHNDTIIELIDEKFAAEKPNVTPWQHIALVKYLVRKGFLNEKYYLYTTVFNNSEHWTLKDQQLFLKIQSRQQADHSFAIDNPEELVKRLSDIEFNSPHIFNTGLLDYLLQNCPLSIKTSKFLQAIREHYSDDGGKFLRNYLSLTVNQKILSDRLLVEWPNYLETVFESSSNGFEAHWLINTIDKDNVENLPSYRLLLGALREQPEVFIESHTSDSLVNPIELIIHFELNIPSLEAIKFVPVALQKILDAARFDLTLDNMFFALMYYGASDENIKKQTYQEILKCCNKELLQRVNIDITDYVKNLMFRNLENTEEPEGAVLCIINNSELTDEAREKVIAQQSHVFNDLQNVSNGHNFILSYHKVLPSWQLLIDFYDSELINLDTFIKYLSDVAVVEILEKQETSSVDKNYEALSTFLLCQDDMEENSYVKLNKCLIDKPLLYWPEVSDNKKEALLEHKLIALNLETYNDVADKPALLAQLVVNNTKYYLNTLKEFPPLDTLQISEILKVNDDQQLMSVIAEALDKNDVGKYTIDKDVLAETYLLLPSDKTNEDFIEALIHKCSKDVIIERLFARLLLLVERQTYIEVLTRVGHDLSKNQIKSAISSHPDENVSNLTEHKKRPGLPITEYNRQLLEMLKEVKILSEYVVEGDVYRVRKLRSWW
jgi:hypothetical protein